METHERICRLCLKINNCKAIKGDMKDALDTFLPKIDLAATQEPMMCIKCAEMLIKCLDFKVACCDLHSYTVMFVDKENVKLDLKDVYLNRNENGACITEDQDVCGFCMGLIKSCFAISLDIEKRNIVLGTMIDKCLPELDLRNIKKPVICPSCYGNVENCFHFVTDCLTGEEKLKEYCKTLDINSKGQIDLSQLLQFKMENARTSEVEDDLFNIIKIENQPCEEIGNEEREIGNGGQIFCDDREQGVEYKTNSFMDIDDVKLNSEEQVTLRNMVVCKKEGSDLGVIKMEETSCGENKLDKENSVEMIEQKCLLNEEIEIKTDDDFVRLENGTVLQQPDVTARLMTNLDGGRSKPHIKQTFKSKNVSAIKVYHCEFCPFRTKCKRSRKMHLREHKNPIKATMHKCDSCSFQTKHKQDLKSHLLQHMDPSKIIMYKCESCSFQTKRKQHLKNHLLNHKDPSEVTMYKCDFCSLQMKRKHEVNRHLLVHKNPSEVPMYKCDLCSFQTKRKHEVKRHLLVHKNPSEVPMYKCDLCSFQTKRKHEVKRHLLVHKDPSEVPMHKCDLCTFQTKRKQYLKNHLLKHKDPSEVTMYKCDSCSFQTKHKQYLKCHLLKYKDLSEVTISKCVSDKK